MTRSHRGGRRRLGTAISRRSTARGWSRLHFPGLLTLAAQEASPLLQTTLCAHAHGRVRKYLYRVTWPHCGLTQKSCVRPELSACSSRPFAPCSRSEPARYGRNLKEYVAQEAPTGAATCPTPELAATEGPPDQRNPLSPRRACSPAHTIL